MIQKIAVIGAGSWGTTLAQLLSDNGHGVVLWVRNPDKAREIEETRINAEYLPALRLQDNVIVTSDLAYAVNQAQTLFLVVPSHGMANLC